MIDKLLYKLPESTVGWTCPWFWTISWFNLMATLCAIVEPSTLSVVAAIPSNLCWLFALAERSSKEHHRSCHRHRSKLRRT